ncbi:MAG TPA: DUF92 domain-containing protein [Terriglobales bacterium]|nr:DUF92 domain-containing protein [Terriglobales bacterium]
MFSLRRSIIENAALSRLKVTKQIAAICVVSLLTLGHLYSGPPALGWDVVLVPLLFAIAGWALRGVSITGAIAGGILAFIFYSAAGWKMFALLFVVFCLTWLATRAGRKNKMSLGLAESKKGRSASQVASNLIVTACALVFLDGILGVSAALVLATAALAEAAADTVSSEIGQAYAGLTYLITNLQPVSPGTNGGLSLIGTGAGMISAALVSWAAYYLVLGRSSFWLCVIAAVSGMMMDSLLGATLERKQLLKNDSVNFFGTLSAAAIAWLLAPLLL